MADNEDESNNEASVLTDKMENALGPTYPYYKKIRSPSALGVGRRGTMQQLTKNISAILDYTRAMVTGNGRGTSPSGPLGNQFFLPTGSKCKVGGGKQDRFIYINNVPTGNLPLVSGAMGSNFSTFKGLVPGMITNMNALNPMHFVRAFTTGPDPACRPLTLPTRDIDDRRSTETRHVADIDIKSMDPCIFPDKKNPVNGKRCSEVFTTLKDSEYSSPYQANYLSVDLEGAGGFPTDTISQIYLGMIGILIIYLIYRLFLLKRRLR